MSQKKPWTDLHTTVYEAVQTKQRKAWVIFYAWFCVCLLIAGAIVTKFHVMCAVFAVLVALAIITERTEAVTERGLETFIDVKLFNSEELWAWDEIDALTYETNPDVQDTTLLYFTKGTRTRKGFFKNEDVVMIKVLAKKKNKNINIYDGNEYRAEARAFNAEQDKYRKRRKK